MIVRESPYQTGYIYFPHHIIIIIMDIDDDMMDVIVPLISGSMVGMVVHIPVLFSLARSLPRPLISWNLVYDVIQIEIVFEVNAG